MTTSYCVHVSAAPPYTTRKARTIIKISGFYHAALTFTPYASCGPCGRATQCSLPSGCQPFSGGIVYPPGINVVFHFAFLFLYSVPHNQVFWRDASFVAKNLFFCILTSGQKARPSGHSDTGTLTPSATGEKASDPSSLGSWGLCVRTSSSSIQQRRFGTLTRPATEELRFLCDFLWLRFFFQSENPGDGNLTISATGKMISVHLPWRLCVLSADAACSVKRA